MNFSAKLWKRGALCLVRILSHKQNFIWLMRVSLVVSFFLITSFELLLAMSSKAQNIYTDKVNINLQDESLLSGLKQIEDQTSLRFFYRKADLKKIPSLTLPPATRTVENALQLLLANTFLSFREVEGSILIEKSDLQTPYQIKGRVVDVNKEGIGLATATIHKSGQSKALRPTQTDTAGYFVLTAIEKGDYVISLSAVGMDSLSISISLAGTPEIQLPELVLSSKVMQLNQVNITDQKPMLERKIDRMVFNISNSIAAQGVDLSQALALTPMLRVTDNSISIVGKSGVAVMINDRILNIGGSDLINYLKSLRSDDVEKIEVITTPPAKYEAQGNSGLINIVLKKNQSMGWSGNASTSFQQTTYAGYANNLNLNYQSNKISSSFKLRQYDRTMRPTEEINVLGMNAILSTDSRKDMIYGYGGNLSTNYQINKNADVGFIYDVGKLFYDKDISNRTVYQTNQITDSILNTFSEQRNPTFSQTLNLYYDQNLDTAGKKLSVGFNYFSTLPKNLVDFETTSEQTMMTDIVRNYSDLNYKIWSTQVDLTLPYSWADVESGLRFTNFDNNSDIGYYNLTGSNYQLDPSKSNLFDYNEKNAAGYFSLQKDLSKKWSAKVGLRYEYSIVDGLSTTTGETNNSRYGKLFPSIYLSFKPKIDHTISFSYSKRINRPNFRALNPFRWYSNPYTYYTGNPFLQPSFNDNFELSYLYKGILSFTFFEQKLSNGFGGIVEVDKNIKVLNFRNYLTQYTTGADATLVLKPFSWWENREIVSFNFVHGTSTLQEVSLQEGSSFYYSTNNTFTLNKTLNIFLNFWHTLPSTQGNVYSQSIYDLSAGIKVTMLNNKLRLNASAEDLLKSTVSKGNVYYQNFTQTYNNYYDSRKFSLSLTYTFGGSKVTGNKKQVNFKETQRAN